MVVLATASMFAEGASAASQRTELVCPAGHLSLSATLYYEAGGQFGQTLVFANDSNRTCELRGWPHVQLVDASGRPVPTSDVRVRQGAPSEPASKTVALPPGHDAAFDIYDVDYNPLLDRACPLTSMALVVPPGDSTRLAVHVRVPLCGFPLHVAPVIAGRSDRQAWSEVVSS
jgi:hypothetical protein